MAEKMVPPAISSDPRLRARLGDMVGVSAPMRELFRQLELIAGSDVPVLLEGGPGTGKSLAALTLHRLAGPVPGPFVALDAARLADLLAARGSAPLAGSLAAAAGGTLVLDEVGDLPLALQGILLRCLDRLTARPSERAGSPPAPARIVSTSRRELRAEASRGRFRADLYYRLRGILLRLPAIAERRDDLPLLFDHLLVAAEVRQGKRVAGLADDIRDRLLARPWKGNVRELEQAIDVAVRRTPPGQSVTREALPRAGRAEREAVGSCGLREYRRRQERTLVLEALESVRWNVTAAARDLGISRVGLSKKIKVLGLLRPAPAGRPG